MMWSEDKLHGKTRQTFKLRARKKLEHITSCERCGASDCLEVHHIDRVWDNNDLANLEKLCTTCHRNEHREECVERGKNFRKHFTCTLDGCIRNHVAKGLCRMHYLRQYKLGQVNG